MGRLDEALDTYLDKHLLVIWLLNRQDGGFAGR
jgi:hypothetical protein